MRSSGKYDRIDAALLMPACADGCDIFSWCVCIVSHDDVWYLGVDRY